MDAKNAVQRKTQPGPWGKLLRQLVLDEEPTIKFPNMSPDFFKVIPAPRDSLATRSLRCSPVNRTLSFDSQDSNDDESKTQVTMRAPEQTAPQSAKQTRVLLSEKPTQRAGEERSRLRDRLNRQEADVKDALNRCQADDNLAGDFKQTCLLPCVTGKHRDLKYVTTDTVRRLVNGQFTESCPRFTIIDCRYPYEFEGGHIQGAKNLYTRDDINKTFLSDTKLTTERHILIFHCEFSSERGPKLARFLRQRDRAMNEENYPYLYYPEIYIMKGGYKEFFLEFAEDCFPASYMPMLHGDHCQDLKLYRAKRKSCETRKRRPRVSCELSFRLE